MAAVLIPELDPLLPHRLRLPPPQQAGDLLEELRYGLGMTPIRGRVVLEADDWHLLLADLEVIRSRLESHGLRLVRLRSRHPPTLVAAAAFGLETECTPREGDDRTDPAGIGQGDTWARDALTIHRGTLRSGDHLQGEGTVLLLGDVNPGARISAGGHVLVWGRLRGVAHAGRWGDTRARIVALQLQPLQLRIGSAVARGPDERPPEGLAEEARLVKGEITIEPAPPTWPLDLPAAAPAEPGPSLP
ncbi:MAG: septum site-determining protein MinC [Synechococcaceae cyanobacterium]|nr:septum site-determining protein MinC [Synechococcaceae cyanobacterium]